jgi:hypothetical protein
MGMKIRHGSPFQVTVRDTPMMEDFRREFHAKHCLSQIFGQDD